MDIDSQRYEINAPSVIYMHLDQVHQIIAFENVIVCAWAVKNENLNHEYLKLLEEIMPAAPMSLNHETFAMLEEAASFCIRFAERKKDQFHHSLLKDQVNARAGLVISSYSERRMPADKLSRSEEVTKAFRETLALNFFMFKRPAEYAQKLNLSTAYLNECFKNSTGHSVSYHIQQRVVLEAKRLLYHSGQSLKEIAAKLGYDDYAYFSRLFTKAAGTPPSKFSQQKPFLVQNLHFLLARKAILVQATGTRFSNWILKTLFRIQVFNNRFGVLCQILNLQICHKLFL